MVSRWAVESRHSRHPAVATVSVLLGSLRSVLFFDTPYTDNMYP
jgi:hypothetical protein